jgi:hypothetical protein
MLSPHARIPVVTLLLNGACQPVEMATTSAPTAAMTSTETGATSTGTVGASETGAPTGGPIIGTTEAAETSTSTDVGTAGLTDTGESSGSDSSGGPSFPAVDCGELTCRPGEFCVVQLDECHLIPVEVCDDYDTTGAPEPDSCWDLIDGHKCAWLPPDCLDDPRGLKACIEDTSHIFCVYYGEFDDYTLFCEDYPCEHLGPYYGYCMECW